MKCKNGLDYEECENEVDKGSEYCSDCEEAAYEAYLSDYYGGSAPITLKEQQDEARKRKSGN